MQLSFFLDAPQATQLQRRAAAKDLSPEQAARELLGHVLRQLDEADEWGKSNQRRLELLAKSRSGLTAEESEELQRLQAEADRRMEATDRQLLRMVEQFR